MDPEYRNRIEDLYLQMYEKLFWYAKSSLSSDALAEEAVQDAFAIACAKVEECLSSPNPQGWLVNTLKYVISNELRNRELARKILSDYCRVNIDALTVSQDRPRLELLYGQLTEREEFILVKEMAVDGLSYLEMAKARNISQDACRKRVQRAREFLQKFIEK